MIQPPQTQPKLLRSTMIRTTTSVCLPPRHRTNSLLSLFRRSARGSPPLAVGLPPAPNPLSVAQLPTVPPPEQTRHPQSQQGDQRSPPPPVSKVGLVAGWWWAERQIVINNCPSASTGGGSCQVSSGLSGGQETLRCRRNQQHDACHRCTQLANRQYQLLNICLELYRKLC